MKLIEKTVLTIIYPFWVFFAKTWFGNVMSMMSTLFVLPIVLSIFTDVLKATGKQSQDIATGVAFLSLICSPFVGMGFIAISDYLERKYESYNYRIPKPY